MDTSPTRRVEVLSIPGCPNHEATVQRAREVARALGVPIEIAEVEVQDLDDATRRGFLGSPSVRVDGLDIESAARADTAYAIACRPYDGGGVPPTTLFVEALGATTTPAADGTRRTARGWRRSVPAAAGGVALLLPVGTCPACFPAYAAVLSSFGLGFLLYERYLLPIASVLLAVALGSLAYRARRRRGYGPFVTGTLGSILALVGKFALGTDLLLYLGLSILAGAATWNAWPHAAASPSCARCAPQGTETEPT